VSRNIRILLVAAIAFAAVGGYWKLVLAPKRAEAADLAKQVNAQKAQLAQSQSLLATYRGAQNAYKANYATVVRLGTAVPSDDDTRSLVVQLDAAANRSNTAFDNIDVTAAAGAGNQTSSASSTGTSVAPGAVSTGAYSVMPFSLAFNGDFSTLESFLGRLQRFVTLKGDKILVNGRLMRVESINLQPGDKGWPRLNAVVTASSYIVPDDADAAAASSATPSTNTTTTTAAAADQPGSLR
jgi:Tfp pilus assembly protein PilO